METSSGFFTIPATQQEVELTKEKGLEPGSIPGLRINEMK